LPGACDVGTIDRLALAGLVAGLQWLEEPQQGGRLTQGRIRVQGLAEAIGELPGTRLHGRSRPEDSLPTIALTVQDRTPAELAQKLAERRIVVGSGQQCAPLAHETLGTLPDGVLRISFGAMNTDDDGAAVAAALAEILS
jgi:selenocysteine lyase/cysteine desulfurase